MTDDRPLHDFDRARARPFRPRRALEKSAVLVDVVDADAITEIATSFGVQRLRGPFYAVADGSGSYGASRVEFEETHERVGEHGWVKVQPVLAYRAGRRLAVATSLGDHIESRVVAEPDDWIVRQHTGEVMVIPDGEFARRYVSETDR